MPPDDALHGRESHSGARKFRRAMKPLKRAKKLFRICRIEPRAVVLHEENHAVALALRAELNPRALVPRTIFPGVSKQVIQHHAQETRVAVRPQAVSDNPLHFPAFICAQEFICNRMGHI